MSLRLTVNPCLFNDVLDIVNGNISTPNETKAAQLKLYPYR